VCNLLLTENSVEMSLDAARKSVPKRASAQSLWMKMGLIVAAVEVVARTGYGEAVKVFDLGPWAGKTSGSPGDRTGRTRESD
jgi:hypothetical protein